MIAAIENPVTLAAVARRADIPHTKARRMITALGIEPDMILAAGRGRMWIWTAEHAEQIAERLRRVAGQN